LLARSIEFLLFQSDIGLRNNNFDYGFFINYWWSQLHKRINFRRKVLRHKTIYLRLWPLVFKSIRRKCLCRVSHQDLLILELRLRWSQTWAWSCDYRGSRLSCVNLIVNWIFYLNLIKLRKYLVLSCVLGGWEHTELALFFIYHPVLPIVLHDLRMHFWHWLIFYRRFCYFGRRLGSCKDWRTHSYVHFDLVFLSLTWECCPSGRHSLI
jgi:hypothetical protein